MHGGEKSKKVCVVGLGYIGLPTASFLSMNGYNVIGVDVQPHIVDLVNRGKLHFEEPDLEIMLQGAVAARRLRASLMPEPADVFVIAVPTPIRASFAPDLTAIYAATQAIAPKLRPGDLIILESTSPVGTTDEIAAILMNTCPHLNDNGRLLVDVAHCPERVLPGRILIELADNDRIVGGINPQSTKRAAEFYRSFVKGRVLETDARTAELAKLTENAFRDVNIAFANELSIISDRLGINVWELIKLANCHPRVNILSPGPGVGGHCIAVDPWFIVAAAPEEAQLIRQARLVNDGKRDFIIAKVRSALAERPAARIACLGLAFKANVDDLRESPALHIVEALRSEGLPLVVCEPMIRSIPATLAGAPAIAWEPDPVAAVAEADIVLLLVDHNAFRSVPASQLRDKIVIDTRGLWNVPTIVGAKPGESQASPAATAPAARPVQGVA